MTQQHTDQFGAACVIDATKGPTSSRVSRHGLIELPAHLLPPPDPRIHRWTHFFGNQGKKKGFLSECVLVEQAKQVVDDKWHVGFFEDLPPRYLLHSFVPLASMPAFVPHSLRSFLRQGVWWSVMEFGRWRLVGLARDHAVDGRSPSCDAVQLPLLLNATTIGGLLSMDPIRSIMDVIIRLADTFYRKS